MKTLILVAVALLLTACEAAPLHTAESGNKDVTVEVIAEGDGANVYRLEDGTANETIYFVMRHAAERRISEALTTAWTTEESCGKGCTRTRLHAVAVNER